jgi:predicted transcriptional regulator of viral defense system
LGARENAFLMDLASSGKSIFTIKEARDFWGSPNNTRIAVHRLMSKGWLVAIERGKYLIVPLEAGISRKWTEDSFIIASALVEPAAVAYWSAIRHWNWTEQIPRVVYVQTTKRKKRLRRKVLGVQYEFVTIPKSKFYGLAKEWRNGKLVLITDREKTLIDCADDVERAGTIEELAKAVKSAAVEISWERIDEYLRKFPNGAAKKRLGYLFETHVPSLPSPAHELLESWQQTLSAGVALLQPAGPRTGKIVTRWRILINAEVS